MELTPFLLNRWLDEHHFASPPVELDLAASTGPTWTLREILALLEPDARERLLDAPLYYPPAAGGRAIREAIAGMAEVAPDDVQITTGAAEALWIVFLVAAEPGGNAILPAPGFPTFSEAARALSLAPRYYPLRPETGYRIDPDEIRRLVDRRTRLILINSPHNPTGAVLAEEALAELHALAGDRRIPLVVDEVYHPLYHGRAAASAARLPGATVLGDLSKAFCLSGLRLGWIVERDAARRERYEDARTYLTVSASPFAEALGAAAVRHREAIFARARQVAAVNLPRLEAFFARHADQLGWVPPRGGLTVFPWLRSGEDARGFCREAARHGVLLAPGDCFGMPPHFRLGFGAAGDRFAEALGRLGELLSRQPAGSGTGGRPGREGGA